MSRPKIAEVRRALRDLQANLDHAEEIEDDDFITEELFGIIIALRWVVGMHPSGHMPVALIQHLEWEPDA